MRLKQKKVAASCVGLVLLAALVVAFYRYPRIQWRMDIWAGKTAGRFPDVGWADVVAATLPASLSAAINLPALSLSPAERGPEPCPVLWRSRMGDFWGRGNDGDALRVALRFRIFDSIYLRGSAAIRPGDVVIDGGSHLGTFTRFALDRGAGLVVAVEPDPISMECFRKTFQAEIEKGRVIPVGEALWIRPGRIRFMQSVSSISSAVVEGRTPRRSGAGAMEIAATSVDHMVEALRLHRVDFLKLNLEGSEKQAIEGATRTLMRYRPRMLVNLEHDKEDFVLIPRMVSGIVPDYRIVTRGRQQACFYLN